MLVIIKYGPQFWNHCMMSANREQISIILLTVAITSSILFLYNNSVYAQAETEGASDAGSSKLIGAGMAFGLAAAGSGIGLGFVGAAGLAAISDNPKMQSRVFIFVGMVESIAIYGIVMMFIILGQ
ncbi:MAG TPA: ATP synthase subunit C [Nitrososphaeraceae archaeon]